MDLQELKKYYSEQAKHKCIKLMDSLQFSQLILIRHGEPNVDRNGIFTKEGAKAYNENYYGAEVINYKNSPICTANLPAMNIFHSKLKRAEHTAQLIFDDPRFNKIASEQFIEFERGPVQIPLVKMPIKWWNILSRFLWFLDIGQKEVESYSRAKVRVVESASLLTTYAKENRYAVLVAHGIFNKFLGIQLKKMGWYRVHSTGGGFLGTSIFAKKYD